MQTRQIVVFGGGCFWCTEAVFKMLKGVTSLMPGYTGGVKANPTYEEVCSGSTGHAEAIRIEYDPTEISFHTLLTVFFATHDPSTLNRQGNDVGTQYRSSIFYTTEQQKQESEAFIKSLNDSSTEGRSIVTEVRPLGEFYPAETYHQDYFAKNPQNPYCQVVINPKLEKVQHKFAQILKDA
ncbi:MAG: peptide-methionine (S)-S-oxide reductase [Candidatus Ryanbacteria bacterium RIFCSPHIGHO2_02_FULL_48_12]|uniref:Peptide methionine sulfoxide reductase MsrA n=1 Tax=Candidatus Ryanbacteria bacterium RIFCSPHIGHO2_01_FULL_48_27 TaxID=1802115 RepID=A0A1G2G690_9BACT|nr:MAG: peptide-methionine (S)-S-oxide reductase [Candidatus Ryanbacteria bacterium RIFCSPHIGHO2_01_FULL_48_27]OGZ49289.1 MAG: peptide-methionine (S)-S-oxide reductase [Candidatus Ryanbacteria bacterium RIFCSPHIGHO2_02_FULL_48_12]